MDGIKVKYNFNGNYLYALVASKKLAQPHIFCSDHAVQKFDLDINPFPLVPHICVVEMNGH